MKKIKTTKKLNQRNTQPSPKKAERYGVKVKKKQQINNKKKDQEQKPTKQKKPQKENITQEKHYNTNDTTK